jgi:lipopolysaccharide/colanic/teichoic acid biosynthesis glycosyltransferase
MRLAAATRLIWKRLLKALPVRLSQPKGETPSFQSTLLTLQNAGYAAVMDVLYMTHIEQTYDGDTLPDQRGASYPLGYFSDITRNAGTPSLYVRHGKRILDVALVILSLPVLLPLLFCIAISIACDGGAPFFAHTRIGKNGTSFRCWKLRSMRLDAEEMLHDYLAQNPDARLEWEAGFKLRLDPRITRLGNFLRRSSLDELPQLWNVFCGEMSLVGPRPVTAKELDRYGDDLAVYLDQMPGLTGKWQVNGRNSVTYDDRVRMDAQYAAERSFMTDLGLIGATVLVVLRRTGT